VNSPENLQPWHVRNVGGWFGRRLEGRNVIGQFSVIPEMVLAAFAIAFIDDWRSATTGGTAVFGSAVPTATQAIIRTAAMIQMRLTDPCRSPRGHR
jgi:hypothetical protein